jgi:hypothetical protein
VGNNGQSGLGRYKALMTTPVRAPVMPLDRHEGFGRVSRTFNAWPSSIADGEDGSLRRSEFHRTVDAEPY